MTIRYSPEVADQLRTTKEASEVLNVPMGTLRWWRHIGYGPKSFLLSKRKVMYKQSDLDAWLREQYEAGE